MFILLSLLIKTQPYFFQFFSFCSELQPRVMFTHNEFVSSSVLLITGFDMHQQVSIVSLSPYRPLISAARIPIFILLCKLLREMLMPVVFHSLLTACRLESCWCLTYHCSTHSSVFVMISSDPSRTSMMLS